MNAIPTPGPTTRYAIEVTFRLTTTTVEYVTPLTLPTYLLGPVKDALAESLCMDKNKINVSRITVIRSWTDIV